MDLSVTDRSLNNESEDRRSDTTEELEHSEDVEAETSTAG